MVTHVVWHDADTNGDESVSDAEAEAWVRPLLESFSAELDGAPLDLQLVGVQWADDLPSLRTGVDPILIELWGDWVGLDVTAGHELLLLNDFNASNSLSWYSLTAEGMGLSEPKQDNGLLTVR